MGQIDSLLRQVDSLHREVGELKATVKRQNGEQI